MSKAFTSEQDPPDAPARPLPMGRRPITPRGMATLQQQLLELVAQSHAALAARAADDSDARAQERALSSRVPSTRPSLPASGNCTRCETAARMPAPTAAAAPGRSCAM